MKNNSAHQTARVVFQANSIALNNKALKFPNLNRDFST